MSAMTRIRRSKAGSLEFSPMRFLQLSFAACMLIGLFVHFASADEQPNEPSLVAVNQIEKTNSKEVEARKLRSRNQTPPGDGKEELLSKRFVMELGKLVDKDGERHSSTEKVILETRPAWAPIGVAHFHDLVANGFYDQCKFFRVLPDFMVQFGISGDPNVQKKWRKDILKDDPVKFSNNRGTVTYATAGPNTRTSQLFVNTNEKGNAFLDKQGFAPFAEVVEGMEFIDMIDAEYREKPDQGRIQQNGNKYLDKNFPNLSYIMTIREDKDDTPDTEGGGR